MSRALIWIGCLHLLASLADAQQVLASYQGPATSDNFGFRVAMAGDIDGDGYSDPIVSGTTPFFDEVVRIFSGRTGVLLRELTANDYGLGYSLGGCDDLNGDGTPDYFIGSREEPDPMGARSGSFRIYSGSTGAVLLAVWGDVQADDFGAAAANIGDVTGDGVDDFVVGAPGNDFTGAYAGQAKVLSGADGAVLYTSYGTAGGDAYGYSCAGCGDVDADGVNDFIVGAPQYTSFGLRPGYARVYSGATGALLHEFFGVNYQDRFGTQVSGAGDVNNDGHADVVVGAEHETYGFNKSGSATVFSGVDGAVIFKRGGGSGNAWAAYVTGGFDYDGDGGSDVAVGGFNEGAGRGVVRVYRGFDGALIQQIDGAPSNQLGLSLASAGDLDGSGSLDLIVGAIGAREARVYSRDACTIAHECVATPNSVGSGALIDHTGVTSVSANDLALQVRGLPSNTTTVFYFGSATLTVPYFDGVRCVSGQVLRLPATASNGSGDASIVLDRVNGPPVLSLLAPGTTWRFQAVYRDAGFGQWGVNTSDSVAIGFCQ